MMASKSSSEAPNKGDGGSPWKIMAGLVSLILLACLALRPDSGPASSLPQTIEGDRAVQPAIIFIVMDTVRADHLSLCGYERPTSPVLESLVQGGADFSCDAHSLSGWTLPSHASFFTGELPSKHRVGNGPGSQTVHWGTVSPLPGEFPTLAEQLAERDYSTVMVSANPLVSERMGLTRGFQTVVSVENFREMRGRIPQQQVARVLSEDVDPQKPLFLFVNLVDAHSPWVGVPARVPWLPQRPGMESASFDQAFNDGEIKDVDEAVAQRVDIYDYGVHIADRSIGAILAHLNGGGWLAGGYRLIITSDHGEYLGGHGLLGHGKPQLYEPQTRVPLLFFDSTQPSGADTLPSSPSALISYHLALDGEVPPVLPPVFASHWMQPSQVEGAERSGNCRLASVALWAGDDKLHCYQDEVVRYDLKTDPEEEHPLDPDGHPDLSRLLEHAKTLEAVYLARGEGDAELTDMLRGLGYLE